MNQEEIKSIVDQLKPAISEAVERAITKAQVSRASYRKRKDQEITRIDSLLRRSEERRADEAAKILRRRADAGEKLDFFGELKRAVKYRKQRSPEEMASEDAREACEKIRAKGGTPDFASEYSKALSRRGVK